MEARLVEYGDGVALVLDRSVLDALNITVETPIEVSIVDHALVIKPAYREARSDDIRGALERANQRYPHTLKRLAE